MGGKEAAIAIQKYLLEEQNLVQDDVPKIVGLTDNQNLTFGGQSSEFDNTFLKPLSY